MLKTMKNREGEKGNVLFLILIAVALFAALSYAVTQSSRSGGGDAGSETNLVNSAQITQYPAGVRTSIIRMIVSSGASPDELEFNRPSDFGNCLDTDGSGTRGNCVFHPDGGGATFAEAPAEVVTGTTPQSWVINGENEINLVGTTVGGDNPDATTAEIIAFLPNVQRSICEKINEELGISGGAVPTETGINVAFEMVNTSGLVGGVPGFVGSGTTGTIGEGASPGPADLDAQPFGCFQQPAGTYYYYHVLIEQ